MQEMLAVWLVAEIRIAVHVEFLDYFCSFWDGLQFFLNFYLKVRRALAHCPSPSTTDIGALYKAGCVVNSGGRNCCGYGFFRLLSTFCDFLVYSLVWRKVEGAPARTPALP